MPSSSGPGRRPDVSAARARYRQRASRYDLELLPFEPLRTRAIELLDVAAGDTVLDIGCGTGLSFPPLKARLGPQGRIVAVDPSPEMLALAQERIARHHWSGIELLQAPAAAAPLHGRADAALFHFTHDVLREPEALDHVIAHLKPDARVVATGLQWAPPWLLPTNLFVWAATLYSVTCMEGLQQPWSLLARRLRDFHVRSYSWAGLFVAHGRVRSQAAERRRGHTVRSHE
jgi:demethylmenaquinone methyltransferase/2-methoxy-6-polyprenyl-1,4-benzoquinol methylase